MARLFTSGFEIASNTNGHEWANAGVSGAARTTTGARSGAACGQVNALVSATQAGWATQISASLVDGPFYLRAYLKVDTAPSADNCIMALIAGANVTAVSVNDAQIRLTSTRTLRLFATDTAVGSASAALTAGQWYMVELEVDNSPASGSKIVRAYLDGSLFAGSTTATGVGGTMNGVAVGGNLNAEAQTTGDWSFDDVAANDSSGAAQNGLPGAGKVIVLRPNAAGDSNQWNNTANGAGDTNNFALVDETAPDDATTMVQSGTVNNLDLYNFEASGISGADTVNVVHVHLRRRNNVADAAAEVTPVVVKTSGGTQATGVAVIPNTTTWRTGAVTSSTVVLPSYTAYLDPDGAAWTQSTLDTMQAGPKLTAAGVNRVQVSTVWATVDYTPSTTVSGPLAGVLPALTTAATGAVGVTGAVGATLPALDAAATGVVAASGALAATLSPLSAAAVGTVSATGTIAAGLPALAVSADGMVSASGTAAVSLPPLAGALTGAVGATGTLAATLPAITAATDGDVTAAGALAATLPALATSASGQVGAAGAVTVTLPALSVATQGEVTASGAIAAALPALDAAAAGSVDSGGGPLTVTLPALAAATAGQVSTPGVVAATLPALTVAFDGSAGVAGPVAVTLPPLTVTTTGSVGAAGTLTVTLPALDVAAVGAAEVTGAAGITLPALDVAATGQIPAVGALAATLPPLAAALAGTAQSVGPVRLPALSGTATVRGPGGTATARGLSGSATVRGLSGTAHIG